MHGGTDPALIAETVSVLHGLAAGGRALEFAVGTGRIALPLAARGTSVSGIELSSAMVDVMRNKPGGDAIEVAIGDMTEAQVEGPFSLVFLIFNTISNLTTQEAQVACFQNASAHLAPGGRFVIENQVPPLQRLPFGETTLGFSHGPGHEGRDEFDVATQTFSSHHEWRGDGATRRLSVPFRYVWPSELDLMARMAGMSLESRWQDWRGAPFTRLSESHVSVWRKDV